MFMHMRNLLAAVLLSIVSLNASAQASLTTKTTGTSTSNFTLEGYFSVPVGAAYEVELTSEFVPAEAWFQIPDVIYTRDAQVQATITVNGTAHRFAGQGTLSLSHQALDVGGVMHTIFHHSVELQVPGSPFSIQVLHVMGAPLSDFGAANLFGLFAQGSGSFDDLPIWNDHIVAFEPWVGNAHGAWNVPSTISFTTTGNLSLAPVPEPSSVAMMLAGMAIVGAAARRRRS